VQEKYSKSSETREVDREKGRRCGNDIRYKSYREGNLCPTGWDGHAVTLQMLGKGLDISISILRVNRKKKKAEKRKNRCRFDESQE